MAAFPVSVTEDATAAAAERALQGGAMTANVRRAIVDGNARLHEALTSMRRYGSHA